MDLRLLHRVAHAVADIRQNALDLLAIVHVLLAAEGMHIGQRGAFVPFGHQLRRLFVMFKMNDLQNSSSF